MIADLYLTYNFIRKLATPYTEWDAYKLGIIDENGIELKPIEKLRLQKERDAYGYFDRVVNKVKRTLAKVPGGSSLVGTYAAALWFIKEDHDDEDVAGILEDYMHEVRRLEINEAFSRMLEDAPVNCAGSGAVAAIGIGPDGEPGKKRKKKWSLPSS